MSAAIESLYAQLSNGELPDLLHQYICGNIRHVSATTDHDNGYDLSLKLIKALPATPTSKNWNSAAKFVFNSYCENALGVSHTEFSKKVIKKLSTDELSDLTAMIVAELQEISIDCEPVQVDYEALALEVDKQKQDVTGPKM